jgi:mRNA interferase RelE/StbE
VIDVAYRVEIAESASKSITKLHSQVALRVRNAILSLAQNPRPHGVKKLQGENAYRLRVGDYRIVYTINDRHVLVIIIRVGHRRDIYMRRTDK